MAGTARAGAAGLRQPPSRMRRLAVATYNIHGCVGVDGRDNHERIATVITELRADVIGLQEVTCRSMDDLDQAAYLARKTGFEAVVAATHERRGTHYGNVLLTSLPVADVRRLDLSVSGREPRGALDVDVECEGERIRVIATHLGLRIIERRRQMTRLLDAIAGTRDRPIVLLGDFNEWLLPGRLLRRLHARFGRPPAVRSFPSWRPLFALDRIWVQPRTAILDLGVHCSPTAMIASDHLPVWATLAWLGSA
jgi:endonuclease/exonuclease/phosphatase family metal-dependent hydrolase